MDRGCPRKASRWRFASTSLHLVKEEDKLQQPELLGLCDQTARQLPSCEEHSKSTEVRYKGQSLCKSRYRRGYLSQIEDLEERINLRMGRSPNERREDHRRIRRRESCHSSTELTEAAGLPEVSEPKEKEIKWIESDDMDTPGPSELASGFSVDRELDEQESWFPDKEELQAEAIMDIRRYEGDHIDHVGRYV